MARGEQMIERARLALLTMADAVRQLLVGPDPWQLFVLLFALELWMLYGLFRARGDSVVVFSHLRLVIAVVAMSGVTVVYWRLALLVIGPGWIRYLTVGVGAYLAAKYILTNLQQTVLSVINRIGGLPITKDLERAEFSGNDCNYSVIRRWAVFVMIWFVLIPGLIVTMPASETVVAVLLVPWLCMVVQLMLMTAAYWAPVGR
jgi:hypothetical protein